VHTSSCSTSAALARLSVVSSAKAELLERLAFEPLTLAMPARRAVCIKPAGDTSVRRLWVFVWPPPVRVTGTAEAMRVATPSP
jgi:hypothetical protein